MRYIAIRRLKPDAAWLESAGLAAGAVRSAPTTNRQEIINAHQHVWKRLKDSLRELSFEKCWYCESIDPRSDNAVDHYRPKGAVRDAKRRHDGYWWLAFEWTNYRFSCTYCNSIRSGGTTSGGKHDYFPLWDEDKRAQSEDEIEYELPLLLDPTRATDVRLIAFSEDGGVGAAVEETRECEYKMALVTIERYHLRHSLLVEFRAARLAEVRGYVENADKYLALYTKKKRPADLITANEFLDLVTNAVSPRAPYSSAVKHLLAGLAAGSQAARTVLDVM